MTRFSALFLLGLLVSNSMFSQDKNKSTATKNVTILEKTFLIPSLNDIQHKVWVYLPPNYHNSSKKYPVIYMHDAQNLFDDTTSFVGEWGVDESLNKLFSETNKGFIIVGVENGGSERINEYTPWTNEKYGGGKGAIYIDFIVNELKPFIDATYRTKSKQEHTGLIGSSLGGLISYYGGLKYPNIFGKIGALSTSFWYSDEVISFTKEHAKLNNLRLYLLVGEKEGEEMISGTKNMEKLLLKTGFKSKNLKTVLNPEGKHNESFWKSEFETIIKWLYKIK